MGTVYKINLPPTLCPTLTPNLALHNQKVGNQVKKFLNMYLQKKKSLILIQREVGSGRGWEGG